MSKRKPRKRYSRSMVVDHFEAMPGNTKPCQNGACPIVVAMDNRISIWEATTLDHVLVGTIDRYCRSEFGRPFSWGCLSAAEIVRITRSVMREAA